MLSSDSRIEHRFLNNPIGVSSILPTDRYGTARVTLKSRDDPSSHLKNRPISWELAIPE
jgi:hypothetical protein